MPCNPCCCWGIKDGAVTVGIWSCIFSLIYVALFGWQMAAINYEKQRAANTLLPNYNEYGRYDIPSYYESYWQSPEERFYTALFVIQILCLISTLFLLFSSIALIYGAYTYSRGLIWPWFPCMISCILCSLAYCITWWSGDVRDYWLVLTILVMLGVFINIYCFVVILFYYRHLFAESGYVDEKDRTVRFEQYPEYYDEGRRDNYYSRDDHGKERLPELEHPTYPGYGNGYRSPIRRDDYKPLATMSTNEPLISDAVMSRRPIKKTDRVESANEDMVARWVKYHQLTPPDEDQTASEPISPLREYNHAFHHSYSVPSMYVETSGSTPCRHRHHHHHRRRSSSRHRHHDGSACHHRRRRRSGHRCRSMSTGSLSVNSYSPPDSSSSSDVAEMAYQRRHQPRSRYRYNDDASDNVEQEYDRRRRRRYAPDRSDQNDARRDSEPRRTLREIKRDGRVRENDSTQPIAASGLIEAAGWMSARQSGGISIPQHIVIPPSTSMSFGPDGRPLPQTYQINSEIRIVQDKNDNEKRTNSDVPRIIESSPIGSSATYTLPQRTHLNGSPFSSGLKTQQILCGENLQHLMDDIGRRGGTVV
ncbi:hypothetical protein AB6A40_004451 [Gnathostoma spinigerum]|uniref:Uncharacterized protein n=1 Tax=Gnathostoma spinigerum TaxID=75299 RepID=A0ABD6EEP3_9BILA